MLRNAFKCPGASGGGKRRCCRNNVVTTGHGAMCAMLSSEDVHAQELAAVGGHWCDYYCDYVATKPMNVAIKMGNDGYERKSKRKKKWLSLRDNNKSKPPLFKRSLKKRPPKEELKNKPLNSEPKRNMPENRPS